MTPLRNGRQLVYYIKGAGQSTFDPDFLCYDFISYRGKRHGRSTLYIYVS